MPVQIEDQDKEVICHALNVYLSDLRHEIVKTESFAMKNDLHRERDIIKDFIAKC